MDVEERPCDDDDSDHDDSGDNDECARNELDEERLFQFQREQMLKIDLEIERLKNIQIQQTVVDRESPDFKNSKSNSVHSANAVESEHGKLVNASDNNSPENYKLSCVRDGRSSESPETSRATNSTSVDELHVGKFGCKSFHDILEKAIAEADALPWESDCKQKERKREFLRKGKGLERFASKKRQDEEPPKSKERKSAYNFLEKTPGESNKCIEAPQLSTLTSHTRLSKHSKTLKLHPLKSLTKKVLITKKSATTQSTVLDLNKPPPRQANGSHTSRPLLSPEMPESKVSKKNPPTSEIMSSDLQATRARAQNFGLNETQPLIEFEILEGYAMEDASFLSSISTVDKVLQECHGLPAKGEGRAEKAAEVPKNSDSIEAMPHLPVKTSQISNNVLDSIKRTNEIVAHKSSPPKNDSSSTANKNFVEEMAHLPTKASQISNDCRASDDISRRNLIADSKSILPREIVAHDLQGRQSDTEPRRQEYIPDLYAPAGNDDTFSNEAAWNKDEFEDDVSWNDVTLRGSMSLSCNTTPMEDDVPRKGLTEGQASTDVDPKILPKLVSKIFPASEGPRQRNPPSEWETEKPFSPSDAIQSKILREKVLELDVEIEKYKRENASLARIKKELLASATSLKKEADDFRKKRQAGEEEFERAKNEELQKMKKERKLFEAYKRSHEDLFHAREDRKAQEALKSELEKLKEDIKLKEQRWRANSERMRDKIEQLEKENLELKGRLFAKEQELLKIRNQSEEASQQQAKKPLERHSLEHGYLTNRKTSSIPNPPCLVRAGTDPAVAPTHDVSEPIQPKQKEVSFIQSSRSPLEEVIRQQNMPNGSVEVTYAKVAGRVQNPDGSETLVFADGDTQQNFPDGTKLYTFTEHGIRHYAYPDGLQIFRFPCGQVEKIFADGNKEISFPNGNLKYVQVDGSEETILRDGTVVKVLLDGTITKELANGIRETYQGDVRRIEYPGGATKTIHADGSQETRYPSGRVRVKDAEGNLIYDGLEDR